MHKGHGFAADWWALGVLCYELVAGYNPFQGISAPATYSNIVQSSAGSMHLPPSLPPLLCHIVRGLLETEPSKRLGSIAPDGSGGAAAVKAHPWFSTLGVFDFEVRSPVRAFRVLCCGVWRFLSLLRGARRAHTGRVAQKMLRRELPTPYQPTCGGPEDSRNFATYSQKDLLPPATEEYRETEPGWDIEF